MPEWLWISVDTVAFRRAIGLFSPVHRYTDNEVFCGVSFLTKATWATSTIRLFDIHYTVRWPGPAKAANRHFYQRVIGVAARSSALHGQGSCPAKPHGAQHDSSTALASTESWSKCGSLAIESSNWPKSSLGIRIRNEYVSQQCVCPMGRIYAHRI